MSIFPAEIKPYGTPARNASPAPSGFFGQVAAAHEAARRTQNVNSTRLLTEEATREQIRAIEEETGERLPNPYDLRSYDETLAYMREGNREVKMRLGGYSVDQVHELRKKKNIEFFEARKAALREKYPQAQNLYDAAGLDERVRTRAGELDARAADLPFLPSLVGGFTASLTDPLTLATAPAGFEAKTVLGATLKTAAANFGVEAGLQPLIQDARSRLGLEASFAQGAQNVLFAGIFGAGLGAGGKSLARLIELGRGAPDPVLRAGAAELERDAELAADALAAAGDGLDAPALAAHNRRMDAAARVIESETPHADDVKTMRGESEPVLFEKIRDDVAVTATGREIRVEYGLVELSDLTASHTRGFARNPAYPAELQPRDRGRAASAAQVTRIAADLNPRLLDEAADAGAGAPIVSPDGIVESGNGRVIALQKVYDAEGAQAGRYREYLKSKGYPAEKFAEPVLVRRRAGRLDDDARQAFTREANARTTASMSSAEQARADAAALDPKDFSLLDGDNPAAHKNAAFIRQVVNRIAPEAERGALMDRAGRLSDDGLRRVRNAIFAYAYDDEALIARLLDGGDDLKSLGQALIDAAPEWGRLRAELDAGAVDPRVDMRPFLAEAANIVAEARRSGRNVAEYAVQADIFSGAIDARTLAFLSGFFRNDDFTLVRGRAKIAEELVFYATEARKSTNGPGLFGNEDDPGERILDAIRKRADSSDAGTAPGLFDPREDGGAPSLIAEAEGPPRGLEETGRGLDKFDDPAGGDKQSDAALADLEGLADDAELITGGILSDDEGNTSPLKQTRDELDAEFAADDAAIARLKGCVT